MAESSCQALLDRRGILRTVWLPDAARSWHRTVLTVLDTLWLRVQMAAFGTPHPLTSTPPSKGQPPHARCWLSPGSVVAADKGASVSPATQDEAPVWHILS